MNRSYTNRDIKSIRKDLIDRVKDITDKWTDFNESDLGMVYIELMSGIADMLGFYLDKQALECYLPTVKQRKNGKGILSLINYKFNMPTPCSTILNCTLIEDIDSVITIPKYTLINTNVRREGSNYNVKYVTAYDYSIFPGVKTFEIPIIQGIAYSSEVRIKDIPANRRLYLSHKNIAQNSVELEVDGVKWEEINDVYLDDVPGRKYSIHETKDDVTYVLLHDKYKDYLPIDNSISLKIRYLDTLGSEGGIGVNCVTSMDIDIDLPDGRNITEIIEVNNLERSSGGSNRETLDLGKKRAVNNLITMKTAVVLSDYSRLAESIPGILKAEAIDWSVDDSKYITIPYLVKIYLIPENGYECSTYEISKVREFLDQRKVSSVIVECYNAEYVDLDIELDVYTVSEMSNDKESQLKLDIDSSIRKLLSKHNQEFGTGVKQSVLNSVAQNSNDYIDYIDFISPTTNINIKKFEFLKVNNIIINIKRSR